MSTTLCFDRQSTAVPFLERPIRWSLYVAIAVTLPSCSTAATPGSASPAQRDTAVATFFIPATTSAAARGDDDHGDRVAHEFLYCESPACADPHAPPGACLRQPQLCVPETWKRVDIQHDFSKPDFSAYFEDAATLQSGKDNDPADGIEQASLVFYAGEGDPNSWLAWQNKPVLLSHFSAGDDKVRYWWMVSCNVMAHGPKLPVLGGSGKDFLAPEEFKGRGEALEGVEYENVYARWAGNSGTEAMPRFPLNPRLRMACGGSTRIGDGSAFPTAAIWHYKLLDELPVADAFILGLAQGYQVPLCLTRGGADREKTPLYDEEFSADVNPQSAGDQLYSQYAVHEQGRDLAGSHALLRFGFPPQALGGQPQGDPPDLPVLSLGPTPLPGALDDLPFARQPALEFGFKGGPSLLSRQLLPAWLGRSLHPDDLCLKRHPESGATVLSWRPWDLPASSPGIDEQLLSPSGLMSLFESLRLDANQWTGHPVGDQRTKALMPSIDLVRMNLEKVATKRALDAATFKSSEIERSPKCTYLRLNARIQVSDRAGALVNVPVFGEGAQWLLGGCPRRGSGSLVDGSSRPVAADACRRPVPPVLTFAWIGRGVIGSDYQPTPMVHLATARQKAQFQLRGLGHAYQEVGYRWGYKSAPIHCAQGKMYLVYEFSYRPIADDRYQELAPVTVEIPAHDLGGRRIEDTWACASEHAF